MSEKNSVKAFRIQGEYDPSCPQQGEIPVLRLSGAWLQELGFNVGMKIRVIAEKGLIYIQLAKESGDAEDPFVG